MILGRKTLKLMAMAVREVYCLTEKSNAHQFE